VLDALFEEDTPRISLMLGHDDEVFKAGLLI
jgi:hypothetical protein